MKYLCFDTETGGLEPTKHDLLSVTFFVVNAATDKVEDKLELFIKPEAGEPYRVTAEALKVNKIDLVKHDAIAISTTEAALKVKIFLNNVFMRGHKERLIPLGHNVPFDIAFSQIGLGFSKAEWQKYVHYRTLDTATIGRFLVDTGVFPSDVGGGLSRVVIVFSTIQTGLAIAVQPIRYRLHYQYRILLTHLGILQGIQQADESLLGGGEFGPNTPLALVGACGLTQGIQIETAL